VGARVAYGSPMRSACSADVWTGPIERRWVVRERPDDAARRLREAALQRFCERVLAELLPLTQDRSRSHHERYLAVFRLIQRRDEQLAHAFNDPARSRMIVQLAAIHALGLLSPGDLERFTEETRNIVESLAKQSSLYDSQSLTLGCSGRRPRPR